jgi:hypothetical protein
MALAHCPNGHPLRYPSGPHVRAWRCVMCKATVYDD